METTQQLTHWKALTNPNYIGAYLIQPGQDLILTIKNVVKEMVTGPDGKKEECSIIYFMEPDVKPFICNKTNFKTITKIHKTPYIQLWVGKKIQFYSTIINAFGSQTEALRIRDFVPAETQLDVTSAIFKLESCESLAELKTVFLALSKAEQSNKEVKALVEQLKTKLK